METTKHKSGPKCSWGELLGEIHPGRSGNEPAVHKPLLILMILAQAQQGGPNQFYFEDFAPPLEEAIRRFGAAPNPGGAEMPFWHLKNDGIWCVENEDDLPRRSNGDRPTKTGLLEHKAKGFVPHYLWEQLVCNPPLIEQLAVQVLLGFSSLDHAAILKHIGLNVSPESLARQGMLK